MNLSIGGLGIDALYLRRLKPELNSFLDRYLPLFGRSENQPHAGRFVQGLLVGGDRRNIENIAEQVDGGVVRTMQKFITEGVWNDREVIAEMQRQVSEVLGDDDAVLNVDETGFPKKGSKSVGVKRQYVGTMGRVDNCQVGVFVIYCSTHGHALIDRRLFLPEEWTNHAERRTDAGIPEAVIYRAKPALAAEMIQNAMAAGLPFRWVGGDSLFGDSPTFVRTVRALEKWYVLDSSANAYVWTRRRACGLSAKWLARRSAYEVAQGYSQTDQCCRSRRRSARAGLAADHGGRGKPRSTDL